MEKILVTGATGFIGGAIARRLKGEKRAVRALVRRRSDTAALAAAGIELRYGDITDSASVLDAAEGADAIIHCAALASDWGAWETFERINVDGARNVFDAALKTGAQRVVHFSTSDVFGFNNEGRMIDDSFPIKKTGFPYPDTKIDSEELAFNYARKRGMPVVVLRPAWVYGPGDKTFLPEIVNAMRSRQLVFIGSSRNVMALTYIDNLVDATLLALERDEAVWHGYLVCDNEEISWRDLTNLIAENLHLTRPAITIPFPAAKGVAAASEAIARLAKSENRPVITRYALEVTARNLRYSNIKMRKDLGFAPKIMPAEGMRITMEWLKSADLAKIKTK
ncbi:MAG: NAD-dependent epimerase/dehydratase family protein [bacterium]